jgi:general secretion pathway protein K
VYRSNKKRRESERGVVIVVALFIVALVATLSYMMIARLERDIRRTDLLLHTIQAELYAQGGIMWAIDQLNNNWEKQQKDQLIDKLPQRSPTNTVQGYQIVSTLYDMQGRFNINNVSDEKAREGFNHLILSVMPDLTPEKAQEIVLATVDWITPGIQKSMYDKFYEELTPPYRASHRPMVSASEFRLVKGVTPKIAAALKPYLIALPETTPINIQTAPAAVLTSLSPTMTGEAAQAIEKIRQQSPFTTLDRFTNLDVIKNHPVPGEKITLTSAYFLVETEVTIEKQQLVLYTLLQRQAKDAKAMTRIQWQSKGTW